MCFSKIFQNTKLDRKRPPLQAQQSSRSGPAPCPEGAWKIGEVIRSQWNFWISISIRRKKNIMWFHIWSYMLIVYVYMAHIYEHIWHTSIDRFDSLPRRHGRKFRTSSSISAKSKPRPRSRHRGAQNTASHYIYMYTNINLIINIKLYSYHESYDSYIMKSWKSWKSWKHITFQKTCVKSTSCHNPIPRSPCRSCLHVWFGMIHHIYITKKHSTTRKSKPLRHIVSHHIAAWTSWNVAFFLDLANVKMSMSNMSNLRSEFHESNIVKQCHMKREHRKHIENIKLP